MVKQAITLTIFTFVFAGMMACYPTNSSSASKPVISSNQKAVEALAYLEDSVDEFVWMEIDGNNAYIGLSPVPGDWKMIASGAALQANKATNFGFHVWIVDGVKNKKGWRPGDGPYYGSTTARHGKIEK